MHYNISKFFHCENKMIFSQWKNLFPNIILNLYYQPNVRTLVLQDNGCSCVEPEFLFKMVLIQHLFGAKSFNQPSNFCAAQNMKKIVLIIAIREVKKNESLTFHLSLK